MKRVHWLTIVVLFSCAAPLVWAQAATQLAQAPQPVFRSGVELVRLDVRVFDTVGRPVTDLRRDEVEVLQNGRPLRIVQFQHVAEPSGTYVQVARRTIASEVSTNRGAPRGHLYLLVFDQAHITPGNGQHARLAAARFLRTRFRPGDRVALYALPGPGPQVPFTSDVNVVLSKLPQIRGMLNREEPGSVVTMSTFEAYQIVRGDNNMLQQVVTRASQTGAADLLARLPGATNAVVSSTSEGQTDIERLVKNNAQTAVDCADADSRALLAMVSDVMDSMSGLEGRKAVLFFSEGFFADDLSRETERVAAAAARLYSVFYSFDLNARGVDFSATEPQGGAHQAEIQSRMESLGSLAGQTDGQLVVDARSHLDESLDRIADQSRDYYIVAFEPPPQSAASGHAYHLVEVRVSRPGVRVSARTGYALGDPVSPADRRRAIDLALRAPFPLQAVPLEATTYVLRGSAPGLARVLLSLQADLPLASGQAQTADVVFVAKSTRDGRVAASGTGSIPLPRRPDTGRTTAEAGYQVQFDAPPGDYLMRVVVREPGGTTGSVDRRFTVQNFDGTDLAASDLVLGRTEAGGLPVRPVGYVDSGLAGVFEIYARRADDLRAVDVQVNVTPLDSTTPVMSVRPALLDVQPTESGASRGVQVSLPLAGLTPGAYLVSAIVRSRGETAARLMREIDVVPGAAPPLAPPSLAPPTAEEILAGDLAQRYIAALRGETRDPGIVAGADRAAHGSWAAVPALLGPPNADRPAAYHALQGLASFAGERYDEAAGELQAAFAADDRSALTAFFLGWARARSDDDAGAITAWRTAAALQPDLVPAYLALADLYVKRSQPELAVQVLREGLKVIAASPELQAKLSEIERRRGGSDPVDGVGWHRSSLGSAGPPAPRLARSVARGPPPPRTPPGAFGGAGPTRPRHLRASPCRVAQVFDLCLCATLGGKHGAHTGSRRGRPGARRRRADRRRTPGSVGPRPRPADRQGRPRGRAVAPVLVARRPYALPACGRAGSLGQRARLALCGAPRRAAADADRARARVGRAVLGREIGADRAGPSRRPHRRRGARSDGHGDAARRCGLNRADQRSDRPGLADGRAGHRDRVHHDAGPAGRDDDVAFQGRAARGVRQHAATRRSHLRLGTGRNRPDRLRRQQGPARGDGSGRAQAARVRHK